MRLLLIESHERVISQVRAILPLFFSLDLAGNIQQARQRVLEKQHTAIVFCHKELIPSVHTEFAHIPVVFLPLSSLSSLSIKKRLQEGSLEYGSLSLSPFRKEVHLHGQKLSLRKKEFQLLETFLQHPQTTLKYTFLMQQVWKVWHRPQLTTLQRQIANLRQELKRYRAPVRIKTLYGVGYRLEAQ